MKKLFFITATVLFSLNVFSQGLNFKQKVNPNDLIGYWKPDQESSQLFFWKDSNGELQVQEICGSTGEPIDLVRLKVNEDNLIIDTIFKPNQWVVRSEFTMIAPNKLVCHISGDAEATINYTKIK